MTSRSGERSKIDDSLLNNGGNWQDKRSEHVRYDPTTLQFCVRLVGALQKENNIESGGMCFHTGDPALQNASNTGIRRRMETGAIRERHHELPGPLAVVVKLNARRTWAMNHFVGMSCVHINQLELTIRRRAG